MVSANGSSTTQAPASPSAMVLSIVAAPQSTTIRATPSTSLSGVMHQAVNESGIASLVSTVVEGVGSSAGDSDPEQDTISTDNDNSQTIHTSNELKTDASTRVSWFKRFKRRIRRGFNNLSCASGSYYTHE